MLPLLIFLIIWAVGIAAFAVGRLTIERQINKNHYKLAMFSITLLNRDSTLSFLSASDREQLEDIVNDYTSLNVQADREPKRRRPMIAEDSW